MPSSRRDFIGACGAALASGMAAQASPVRALLGAKGQSIGGIGPIKMRQITLTQNCTDCKQLTNHIVALCANEGITNAMCSVVASESRNNLVGIVPIINGMVSGTILRYRNGIWGVASPVADYDADARIGDVYNVYVPTGQWN